MANTVGPSIDKRVVYLGLMLLTLAYPLIALTVIVSTQNDYDDEGHRIKPLPQVSCPVEGAEGDIDCVPTPLAYAHINSIIWVYVINEFVMHTSYVLYTKLWATPGIVFGFWREFLSVVAFLGPELGLNSIVYLCQTLPFMRNLIPSLKTHNFPLLVSFLIGAVLSTLYGLGTSQTTDQFRRAVTLAGPGTMFLFVDWFSRSVFLPFFELMQNTFTQLKVNTLLLAIFELVLTNLYGSLFLPATQKLCVVLARFFYNVSYGVDSKVSLYDYVNLRPAQDGLDPSNPLSKRTTLVSPKDIGTYEPEECRSSFSSLTRRKYRAPRSVGRDSIANVQSTAARPADTSERQDESPQRTTAVPESHTSTTALQISQDGISGTKQALHLPAPQKENDKGGKKRRGQAADRKREDAAGHNTERGGVQQVSAHGKGLPANSAKRDTTTIERAGSTEASDRERRHLRDRGAQLEDRPLPVSGGLHTIDEERRASGRRGRAAELDDGYFSAPKELRVPEEKRKSSGRTKHFAGLPVAQGLTSPPAATTSLEAVDVEVGRCSRSLRRSVDHFLAAPQWTETDANDTHEDSYPGHINEPRPSATGIVQYDASQQEADDMHNNSQPSQLENRNPSMAADAEDDALQLKNPSDARHAVTDAVAPQKYAPKKSVYSGTSGRVYSPSMEKWQNEADAGCGSFGTAERPPGVLQDFQATGERADHGLVEKYNLNCDRRSPRASRTSASSCQGALEEEIRTGGVVGREETPPGESPVMHRHSNVAGVSSQQVFVDNAEGQGSVASRSDKGRRRRSSTPRVFADEDHEDAFCRKPARGDDYVGDHVRRAHKKRQSAVKLDYGQGDDYVEEQSRRTHKKRQSVVEQDCGEGDDYVERHARRTHKKRQSAVEPDCGEGDGYVEEQSRRTHKKRQSAVVPDCGEGDDYVEEHARRTHKKRQSAVEPDCGEADDYVEEQSRRTHKKRQSAVEPDCGEADDYVVEAGRRARRNRQSAVGADYAECTDYIDEPARRAHRKRHSAVQVDHAEGEDHVVETARGAHRKRQSAAEADYGETREGDGGRSAAEKSYVETRKSAPKDGKAAAKEKVSRKNKKHAEDETNFALPERTEPAVVEDTVCDTTDPRKADPKNWPCAGSSSPLPFPSTSHNGGRADLPGGAGVQNPGFSKCVAGSGSGDVSSFTGSFGQGHPKDTNDEQRPFRSNIYIPNRKGFGSDAVEFEKIITWFNMIWDSWRFLLLRTVMIKASNVFIFFVMIFKDFIYSMWHFCVRYDERCILTSLELRSIKSRKNKSIIKMLDWFQALVVRPFFMPTCLSTTTWRSQLLFGLNAQKAQSRMRGVAVIRHSKRKDFGLRTLSNISDNAPLDAPNNPTPQKAVRGLGVMLKAFFKDLGHDLAAHFKAEMELATAGFWGRAQNKSLRRFSRKRNSSLRDGTKLECDIPYAYGSELVVIRSVPVTAGRRSSRSSTTFSSSSRTNSEVERRSIRRPRLTHGDKITFRDLFRRRDDSAFKKVHAAWLSQVVEELQSLVFNRTWPRLLQKLMSSLSLVVSDIFAEHSKVGLLPAYRTFGLFRTYEGRVRLFLIFSFDIMEVLTVWKVQSISRFYKSIKEGFNNLHDGPLLLLCTVNCAGTLMYFGLLRYIRFANIYGDKRILPDVNKMEMLVQLNLSK